MRFGILTSDNGKHSDEKLAIACAAEIIQIGATATGADAIDGRKLENQIVEILERSFSALADFEHAGIEANGTAHLAVSLDAHPEILDSTVLEIATAIAASRFAAWFPTDVVAENVQTAVMKWLKVGQHMHRDWFARHGKIGHGAELFAVNYDPDCPHVRRWKAIHDSGDPVAINEHAAALAIAE